MDIIEVKEVLSKLATELENQGLYKYGEIVDRVLVKIAVILSDAAKWVQYLLQDGIAKYELQHVFKGKESQLKDRLLGIVQAKADEGSEVDKGYLSVLENIDANILYNLLADFGLKNLGEYRESITDQQRAGSN
jgi:hypothetical protein